ncbi:MAG: hypothetical protein J1F35_08855 [Erysipelotrichales bacterium]|nr:hypothetical protein [Erysipelotrichales bacterium]
MKTLVEFIQDKQYNNVLTEAFIEIEAKEVINEAFKSKLLTDLAQKIKKYEKANNAAKTERAANSHWGGEPKLTSFASIFGPKSVDLGRYHGKKGGLEGLKWSEITDSDFEKYSIAEDNKEIKKMLQSVYSRKEQADIIVTDENRDIVYFIKGYGDEKTPVFYFFQDANERGYGEGVKKSKKPRYSYQERDLKWNEAFDLINNLKVGYVNALKVNDSMIKTYKTLFDERTAAKKGIVNFDEESLKQLAKENQARYETLVEEIKTKKLQNNKENLLEEIQNLQKEVMDLYNEMINNIEDAPEYYELGDLMSYVKYAYETYYKALKYGNRSDKAKDDKFEKEYYKNQSDSEIRDVKKYIDRARKEIENINKQR